MLGETLDVATGQLLENRKAPSRKVNELDNRGTHYYLALYWARAVADQKTDLALAEHFAPVAEALAAAEDAIIAELEAAQGSPQDLGGYYMPDPAKAEACMRPSATLNAIIEGI